MRQTTTDGAAPGRARPRFKLKTLPRDVTIEGKNVRLRIADLDHADSILRRVSHPEFPKDLPWALVETSEDVVARLKELHAAWDAGKSYFLGVFTRDSDALIGHGSLSRAANPEEWSIAYMIDSDRQGKGFATEVATLLLRTGFEELGARMIWAGAATWNLASLRVLEKLPMRFVTTNPEGYFIRARWVETKEFEILRSEWISL